MKIKDCKKCALHKNRTKIVNGYGSEDAKIMLVGEAPGADEDLIGEPFVGESGSLLEFIFNKFNIDREELYITNAVKCRPLNNRTPLKTEIIACNNYLKKEIKLIKPNIIIALGAIAIKAILNKNIALKNVLLKKFKFGNSIVIPTIHPARVLKEKKDASAEYIVAAFNIALRVLKEGRMKALSSSVVTDLKYMNLDNVKEIVIDYEEINDKKGIGILANNKHYFYIGDIKQLAPIMESDEIKKIVFSVTAESQFLKKHNVELKNVFDVYPAIYLFNENYPKYNLKFISSILLGKFNYTIDFTKNISLYELLKYNRKDCMNTYSIYQIILPYIQQNGLDKLYKYHSLPMVHLMHEISTNGILINTTLLELMREKLLPKINDVKELLIKFAWPEFNPASTKQVSKLLKKLNIDTGALTTNGQMSTSKNFLNKINHPFIKTLLEYRKLCKMVEKIETLKSFIDKDNRIHAKYTFGTETGRLSSFDPNMQNIDPELRHLFIVPKSSLFIKLDFSQIELRTLAFISQDPMLLKAFRNPDTDIHSYVASIVFGKNATKDDRTKVKKIVFGLIYGMGIKRLANELKLSETKAEKLKNKILDLFPALKRCQTEIKTMILKDKKLINPFKRCRRFEFIYDKKSYIKAIREGFNFMIQSTASDIAQLFFLDLYIDAKRANAKMINFVHDEGDFEVPEENFKTFEEIIADNARTFKNKIKDRFAVDLNILLKIDCSIGHNWRDLTYVESFVIS